MWPWQGHSTQHGAQGGKGSCDTAQAPTAQNSPSAPLNHIMISVLSYGAGKHQDSPEDKGLCYHTFIVRSESAQLNTSVLHWLQGHQRIEIPS